MRKLSLSKLLTLLVSSFALIYGPFVQGEALTSIPVTESYSAALIPTTSLNNYDGSTFMTIGFLSAKDERSTINTLEGQWFLEIAVGIQGLLGDGLIGTHIMVDGIEIKLDDHSSLAAAPTDLFNVPTQEAESAVGAITTWTGSHAAAVGGTNSKNIADDDDVHQAVGGTFDPTEGMTGLPKYFAGAGSGYKSADVKLGTYYAGYDDWQKGPDASEDLHRLGARKINGNTIVDFLYNFVDNEATIGAGENTGRHDNYSCAANSNGIGETTCPFFVLNTRSATVDIGSQMATSNNVTVTYTLSITHPTLVQGALSSAGALAIQTN